MTFSYNFFGIYLKTVEISLYGKKKYLMLSLLALILIKQSVKKTNLTKAFGPFTTYSFYLSNFLTKISSEIHTNSMYIRLKSKINKPFHSDLNWKVNILIRLRISTQL